MDHSLHHDFHIDTPLDGELVRVNAVDSQPREDFDMEVHAMDHLPVSIQLTTGSSL